MSRYIDFYLIGELVDSHNNVHYEDLKRLPPADVRENVKGEWRVYEGNITCMHCGYPVDEITAFCPNCGADMRSRLQGTEIDGMYIDISGDGTVVEQIYERKN